MSYRNDDYAIKVVYAKEENLSSWMNMLEVVKWNFPRIDRSL
jgi:hypothetical protein